MNERRSPRLIQEDLRSAWQMLVACILLNRTRGDTVRPVLRRLLTTYRTRYRMAHAHLADVERIVRPCGFQDAKAKSIVAMSVRYDTVDSILKLPGVGAYAADSWRIFVNGESDFVPNDASLALFLADLRAGSIHVRRLKP